MSRHLIFAAMIAAFSGSCGENDLSSPLPPRQETLASSENLTLTDDQTMKRISWSSRTLFDYGKPYSCEKITPKSTDTETWIIAKVETKSPAKRCQARNILKTCTKWWYDHEITCIYEKAKPS